MRPHDDLDKMTEFSRRRETMSDFAPRITKIKINPEKIRDIIGKGGSMIRRSRRDRHRDHVETTAPWRSRGPGRERPQGDHWIESLTSRVEIGCLYLGP